EASEELVAQIGMTFLFAQVFHPSMKYAAEARRGLGIPTVMNVLGPITNPARPRASAVGVADPVIAPTVAGVFASRDASALVFRGQDGLDELTVSAPSDVWEVRGGQVREHVLDPAALLGIPRSGHDALRGGTVEENAHVARELYAGERVGRMGPIRDAVLLNAAAGVVAFDGIGAPAADGLEDRFTAAFEEVGAALDSGRPAALIERWAAASQEAYSRGSCGAERRGGEASAVDAEIEGGVEIPLRVRLERDVRGGVQHALDAAQPAGDHPGEILVRPHVDHGDEIHVPGDRVDLLDARDVDDLLGDLGDAVGLDDDRDDVG